MNYAFCWRKYSSSEAFIYSSWALCKSPFCRAPNFTFTMTVTRQFLRGAGRDSENCYAVQPLTELLQQTAAQWKSNRTEADNARPQFNATVKYKLK
jgi:hypothetical protein